MKGNLRIKIKSEIEGALNEQGLIDSILDRIESLLDDESLDEIIDTDSLKQWAEDNGYTKPSE